MRHCECNKPTCRLCNLKKFLPAKETVPPPGIALEMRANGIGDALAGLLAVAAAQKKYGSVHYHAKTDNHKWVQLFDGYDRLLPIGGKAINLNEGYAHEVRTHGQVPRYLRYCQACDVEPLVPNLRNRDVLIEAGKDYAGVIALCPFSVYPSRNYSLEGWITVEKLLNDYGLKTVILHSDLGAISRFAGEKLAGRTPEFVASVMLNAGAVVCVESGPAHLSSMIDYGSEIPKTIVLCGPSRAAKVFYCPVVEITSGLHCTGCYWQKPFNSVCDRACASLWNISPGSIHVKVVKIVRGWKGWEGNEL